MDKYKCSCCNLEMDADKRIVNKGDLGEFFACPNCGDIICSIDKIGSKVKDNDDKYYELGEAIIKVAIKDWKDSCKLLCKNIKTNKKQEIKALLEVEAFFTKQSHPVFMFYKADAISALKNYPYYKKFLYLYKISQIEDSIIDLKNMLLFNLGNDNINNLISELDLELAMAKNDYEKVKEKLNKEIKELKEEDEYAI